MKDTSNLAIYNGHKNHVIKIMEKVFLQENQEQILTEDPEYHYIFPHAFLR